MSDQFQARGTLVGLLGFGLLILLKIEVDARKRSPSYPRSPAYQGSFDTR